MRFILTISFLLQLAYGLNVKNVSNLKAYTGTATEIVVMDFREAGTFYKYTGTEKADGGVIVADGKGRLWQRNYNPITGVNVWWWGAKGDGINNDQPAFIAAFKYTSTPFTGEFSNIRELYFKPGVMVPDGLYRFTSPFKYGGQTLSAKDALHFEWYNKLAPSYSWYEHAYNMAAYLPPSITFGSRAYIWGDFECDTLTPVVSIGTVGYVYGGYELQSTKITGLKVIGRNKMKGRAANQVGLLLTGNDIILENPGFYGLQEGMIHNTAYFNEIWGYQAKNCGRGYYSIGCHNTRVFGMRAEHCGVGIEIRSGASHYSGISGEENGIGLIIGDGYNSFDGVYLEKSDIDSDTSEYQLQIGYADGYPVKGTTISALTIAGPFGILMNETARGVTITGSQFVSSATKMKSPLNTLWVNNSFQDIPKNMPGRLFIDGQENLKPQGLTNN